MTEQVNDQDSSELPKQDELTVLKARADFLGVAYHPSIGVEKLREKIEAKMSDKPDPDTVALSKPAEVAADDGKESELAYRARMKKEANELIRIRITCMNPAKKEWEGEIFTIGNGIVGTHKKYVPFNAPDGWHVNKMIYQFLQDRQCQLFRNEKTKGGVTIRKGYLIKEFAIEVLPPLTQKELDELGRRQAMQAGLTVD